MAPIILQLVASVGIPVARQITEIIMSHFETNDSPTPELWEKLEKVRALENTSHAKFLKELKPGL